MKQIINHKQSSFGCDRNEPCITCAKSENTPHHYSNIVGIHRFIILFEISVLSLCIYN